MLGLQGVGIRSDSRQNPEGLGGPGGKAALPAPTSRLTWEHLLPPQWVPEPLAKWRRQERLESGPEPWQPQDSLRPQHRPLPALPPCHCPWRPWLGPGPPAVPALPRSWARAQGCRAPLGPMPSVQPSWTASILEEGLPCGCWPRSTCRLWTGPGHRPEPGACPALLLSLSMAIHTKSPTHHHLPLPCSVNWH